MLSRRSPARAPLMVGAYSSTPEYRTIGEFTVLFFPLPGAVNHVRRTCPGVDRSSSVASIHEGGADGTPLHVGGQADVSTDDHGSEVNVVGRVNP